MITWNTEVNAPCCPGEIVNSDGRTLLIQTDWDYPSTAQSFGWSLRAVQKCPDCGKICECKPVEGGQAALYRYCGDCYIEGHNICAACDHDATDGTVDCKACGVTASDFIAAAYDWLRANNGATADDPGYFD